MDFIGVILSLLALSNQGYAATTTSSQEHLSNEVKEWFMKTLAEFKHEISSGLSEVNNLQAKLKEQGKSEIKGRYELNEKYLNLMNVPPECARLGQKRLKSMMDTSIEEFLLCPNLTLAAEDVVGIGFEGAKLSAQLLTAANEVLHGFNRCWSWNPVKFLYCSFEWIRDCIFQAFLSIKDIKQFFSKINFLTVNIKDQFSYCMNENMARADEKSVHVLNQVHKCTSNGDKMYIS